MTVSKQSGNSAVPLNKAAPLGDGRADRTTLLASRRLKASVAAAEKSGGAIAMMPTEISGYETFAFFLQGAVDHGFGER